MSNTTALSELDAMDARDSELKRAERLERLMRAKRWYEERLKASIEQKRRSAVIRLLSRANVEVMKLRGINWSQP